MAIDDVISDESLALGGSATTNVQPASGDEWLVTGFIVNGGVADTYFVPPSGTDNYGGPLRAGETSVSGGSQLMYQGDRGLRMLITNSEYFGIHNDNGSGRIAFYFAIKTKD